MLGSCGGEGLQQGQEEPAKDEVDFWPLPGVGEGCQHSRPCGGYTGQSAKVLPSPEILGLKTMQD